MNLVFLFGFLSFQSMSFCQSKKKQIESLNFKIDSINKVIQKDRFSQKSEISSLEIQESKTKQSIDSLNIKIKTVENQISSELNEKQKKEQEIVILSNDINNSIDSLTGLTRIKNENQSNYKTVKIGNQTWMVDNLNVSTFRNGDPIPEARTNEEWEKAGKDRKPAWCYYDNDPKNDAKYGKLYNWYAVNDPRGIAPAGWHISTVTEWMVLIEFLGGELYAGTKMKSMNGWAYINAIKTVGGSIITPGRPNNGTNKSGFSGLPSGCRGESFHNLGKIGIWWTSTEYMEDGHYTSKAWIYSMGTTNCDPCQNINDRETGCSIRCVKD